MSFTVVENTPVIYCGGAGGGSDEFAAPVGTPSTYIIDMPVPSGSKLKEAWYTPFDNIADLTKFAQIDVNRHNDTQVQLRCSSYSGTVGRIRVKISALVDIP
ncbi:MAG: hypothetical protein U7123_10265 [Potamolinea sp.]